MAEISPPEAGSEVRTWDLLRSVGFEPDPHGISDQPGALKFAIWGTTFSAIHCLSRYFRPIVSVYGVVADRDSITDVHFEMPVVVPSRDVGLAWLTWGLDEQVGKGLVSSLAAEWVSIGRAARHLLPWEQEMTRYAARPRCQVPREFLRPALQRLAAHVQAAPSDKLVVVAFDGEALSFRVGDKLTVVPADGAAWGTRYGIPVGGLALLPKRLNRELVSVEVWEGTLRIGSRVYPGASPLEPGGLD